MSFYFDYSTMLRWNGSPTGIPRTVFCLATAMQELLPSLEFVAVDNDLGRFHHLHGRPGEFRVGETVCFSADDILFSASAGWAFACYNEQVRVAKSCGTRVFQVFYDLIPALFPFFYEPGIGFGDYFGAWCKEAFSLCDGAFSISVCTKNDMVSVFDLGEERASCIRVIRLGEDFSLPDDRKHGGVRFSGAGKFLLSVGTLELRKNQTCLLNAYRLLAQKGHQDLPTLIIAGKKGWLDGEIEFQVRNDRYLNRLVRVVTDADDHELQWLYENCEFSLFPALYEGWGLPVAESLKAGKPCISSGISSMLEIAPELTIFASPYSAQEWAAAIDDLWCSPGKLTAMTAEVRSRYLPTPWAHTAQQILDEIFRRS